MEYDHSSLSNVVSIITINWISEGEQMKLVILKKNRILQGLYILLILLLGILVYENHASQSLEASHDLTHTNASSWQEEIDKLTNGEEKIAYLTFDDGPSKAVTPKVLDILKEEDVKATFFVIGKMVDTYPETVKRAYEEGHYIANHGYHHRNAILYKNEESFRNEIIKTDEAIGKAIGVENYSSHLFRFPNGFISPIYRSQKRKAKSILESMNYAFIDWNCLNNDSVKKYSNYQLLKNLQKTSKNKGTLVILMHDTKDVSNSSLVLKDSIEYLKKEGYQFRNFYDIIKNQES